MLSTASNEFASAVDGWLRERGEVLLLVRYSRAGGSKDWYLIEDIACLREVVANLPPQTSVIAFRDPQLPVRGSAAPELLVAARAAVPDGAEWLLVRRQPGLLREAGKTIARTRSRAGMSHGELGEDLSDPTFSDVMVAFGVYPPFTDTSDAVMEAVSARADGSVTKAGAAY